MQNVGGRARVRRILVGLGALLSLASATSPALALELSESQHAHVAITLPEGWTQATDGAWALADAPDHLSHVRLASHGGGTLTDLAAEAYLVGLIADTWATYTVDRHVHHIQFGRFVGLELLGHGQGDSWDRARFHLFLLLDAQNPQRAVVVLVTGRTDAWDAAHPALERAVHALHGT